MTTSARAARYTGISHYLLEESQIQLDRGDLIQASEKCWGAVAHAVKSVAQTRGWNHHRHDLLRAVVEQIAEEHDRFDLPAAFGSASDLHQNFYEHELTAVSVQSGIYNARMLISELSAIRAAPPRPFTARTPDQRRRILRLMGSPGPPSDDIRGLPSVYPEPPSGR